MIFMSLLLCVGWEDKYSTRSRSGGTLRISVRLRQSCVLLHGVEECENEILIPSDKHHLCDQMRRADGFSWTGPISLQTEGKAA